MSRADVKASIHSEDKDLQQAAVRSALGLCDRKSFSDREVARITGLSTVRANGARARAAAGTHSGLHARSEPSRLGSLRGSPSAACPRGL